MSANRDLLMLAAKAIGIELAFSNFDADLSPRRKDTWDTWNPRDNDGDALRLASALGLKIDTNYRTGADERPGVGVWLPGDLAFYPPFWTAEAKDINEAVRQTVLRAAAELGRSQPSTLGQQVARAQAEYASWSPEERASVQLQGERNQDGEA